MPNPGGARRSLAYLPEALRMRTDLRLAKGRIVLAGLQILWRQVLAHVGRVRVARYRLWLPIEVGGQYALRSQSYVCGQAYRLPARLRWPPGFRFASDRGWKSRKVRC